MFLLCVSKVTAVFAADAVARMTGTIGAAVVTAGPGLTNTITAVKNAQMAESPVLLMGGAAVTLLKVHKEKDLHLGIISTGTNTNYTVANLHSHDEIRKFL